MLNTLRRLAATAVPAAIALACGFAQPAAAVTVVLPAAATQLNVFRDGGPIDWLAGNNRWVNDGFDNGIATAGPAGVSYSLQGLANPADAALAATESNGVLRLDASYGALAPNAAGQLGRSLRMRLASDITGDAGLSIAHSFAAVLYLPLSSLPTAGQTLGFRLSDGFSNSNDYIELYVAGGNSGPSIVFRKQDFLNHQITAVSSVPVGVGSAPGAESLVLVLAHETPNDTSINGLFSYANANGTLVSDVFLLNGTQGFQGETTTQLELRASTTLPVPEPGTWALMAGGLAAVAALARRRKAA